jgi:hypothetical protein
MKKSCLRCSKYITCREAAKAADYYCQKFTVLSTENLAFGGIESLIEKEHGHFDSTTVLTRKNQKVFTVDDTAGLSDDERALNKVLDKDPNFIAQAMKDAYDPLTNSVRDLKVDDRDLPSALNYFDYCENIAGRTIKTPFARQLWIASQLLGEYCPRCTNSKYLDINNVPVDADPHDVYKKLHVLHNGLCPKCGVKKSELILKKEIVDFNQLALIAGQRAGKSSYSSTVASYILHRYLKAPRLSTICRGIQEFSPLTFTFVGITSARAIKLLWNPLAAIVNESSWFQEYFKMLRHAGNLHDKEFYRQSTLFLRFYHKNLDLYPSAPMKRTLRGDTRILSACLSGSSRILTTDGWLRLDDSTLKGRTAIVDGKQFLIKDWAATGHKETFRLELYNGLFLDLTADHKVKTWDSKLSREIWVACEDLALYSKIICEATSPEVYLSDFNRYLSNIKSITYKCKELVYDITIDSEEHAFNANGIVVKNCDELSWFPYKIVSTDSEEGEDEEDERERANADEVHQALEASLMTVRTEVLSLYKRGIDVIPTGINLNISSPQSELDKLSRIYRECKDSPKETLTLALRLPTWELSPIYTRDHPIIVSAYAKNPRKAERDMGANPPKLSASIFKPELLLPLFNQARPNTHRILYDNTDPEKTKAKVISVLPRSSWKPQILTIDAGLSDNSFAVALGERLETNLVVNAIMEVIPAKGTKIHFPSMLTQVILPMIKECNVVVVASDRWNSIDLLQQIEDQTSARVFQKTLTRKNINAVVASIESSCISFPSTELSVDFIQTVRNYKVELLNNPVSHLFLQMLTVRDYQGMIVKGEGFTDDMFRCVALLHAMTFNKQSMKIVDERPATALNNSEGRARVMVSGRSAMNQWILN